MFCNTEMKIVSTLFCFLSYQPVNSFENWCHHWWQLFFPPSPHCKSCNSWRATAQSNSPVYELLCLWGTSSPTFYPSEKHCPCAQNYVSHTRWTHQRSSDCFTDLLVVHSPRTHALWWSRRATPNWCFKVIQHRMKMAAVGRAPTAFNLLMPHLLSSWGMTFSSIPLSFFLPIIAPI